MTLTPGTRLGPYDVLAPLGAGGMGEVYRARDRRLERDVALKVLPEPLVAGRPGPPGGSPGDDRHARFEREARALASLNHPNIAQIYGLVEEPRADGGTLVALAMELVQGRTLAEAIPPSGLPPGRVLDIALELADALAAAHEHGVVHRDLKPSNIMLRADGHVKVLDFGIAKLRRPEAGADEAETLTQTVGLVGTPAYMSPEQAQGRPADARSDLFSLGVLLYEAATGARPFGGTSTLAVLSSIVHDTPEPVTARNGEVPAGVASTIERLLEKDPDRRYQSAGELRAALEAVRVGSLPPARPHPEAAGTARHGQARALPRVSRGLAWMAAGAVAVAGAAATAWWLSAGERPPAIEKVTQVTFEDGMETHPSLSPDGNWVAYAASGQIYLRRVGTENRVPLTAGLPVQAGEPAFSPDGRLIAFSARRDGTDVRGGIWLMEVTGAGKRRLSEAGFSPAWSPDGRQIAFATEIPLPYERPRRSRAFVVDVTSGQARGLGPEDAMEPAWSPSGRRLAFWGLRGGPAQRDIWTRPAAGGEPTPVTADDFVDWSPAWSHDGRHLFFCSDRSGSANLWRVRIDEETGRVLGEPEPLTTPAASVMRARFAADGSRFAFEASDLRANVQKVPFDPVPGTVTGPAVALTSGTRVWWDVDVSVDGRLVFRSAMRQEDIYVSDADGSNITPLAPDSENDRFPRWSPDGSRIAFSSTKGGEQYEIHTVRPDGRDLRRVTFYEPGAVHFPLWSPDGTRLAFTAPVGTGGQTYVIDPDGKWPAEPLKPLLTPPGPLDIRYRPWSWSPDGRRIVAYSERGAGMIVYDVATGAHEEIASVGAKPRWLGDSRRIVYTHDGALRLMDTRTKQSREIFRPAAGSAIDPALSRDDRWIYYILRRDEGSVWVATLGTAR